MSRTRLLISKVILVFLLLNINCSSPEEKNDYPVEGRNGVLNFQGGSLRTVGGTPLLFLTGTPYERGYQYGVLMRTKIVENVAYYKELLQDMYGSNYNAFLNIIYQREEWLPKGWMDKIHGIADGCGELDYKDILLINAMFGVSFCTSAAIRVNEEFIHVKNHEFGFQAEELPYMFIVEEDPSRQRMMYKTSYGAGNFLPLDGMNDRGISFTANSMPPYEGDVEISERDKMSPFIFRYRILSECSRLDEVEALVESYSSVRPNGYIIVSALDDKAAKFELNCEEYGEEISDTDHIFLTNHYNIQNMQIYQHPASWGYGVDIGTSFLNGQTLCPRYNRLMSTYQNIQYTSDTDTVSLLRDNYYHYDPEQEYYGWVCVNEDTSSIEIDPDDVHAWLIPNYRGLTSATNHISLIMNPNQGYMYLAKSHTYAAYEEFKRINLLGIVNDDWNIDTEIIPGDSNRYTRGEFFYDFWAEVLSGQRNIMDICQDYMAKDSDNPIYYESYGRMLLKDNPTEAQSFFEETMTRFPENLFIKRLFGTCLFEVFKQNQSQSLLTQAEDVYLDILNLSNDRENILPCFILDIYYRLMQIAKERGDDSALQSWLTQFYDRYVLLGSPNFYPFSTLLHSAEQLQSIKGAQSLLDSPHI